MLPSYTTIPNRELNKLLMEKSNTGIMLLVNNKFNKRNYRLWDKVRIKVKGHITVLLRYNVLTTKHTQEDFYMTQVHFTLKSEEIQSIIEYSVKDDVSKNILTTVFNQLMENQRTEYIQAKEYERTENRQSQRNGYYERSFTTRRHARIKSTQNT